MLLSLMTAFCVLPRLIISVRPILPHVLPQPTAGTGWPGKPHPPGTSAFKPAGQISNSLDLIPGCPHSLTNLAEMLVPERGDVDFVLPPPGKIPPVVGFVFIEELQVGGQQPRAREVIDVDEGVRGDEALVVGPAGSEDDGHSTGGEGVSPEFLSDVVGVLGVLEGQVELVG